jgi:ABC-type Fe3+-hydroxamate transport system substrate-binding protein
VTPPVDATGATVATPEAPRRIVSLIPSTTETLCALGLADALVGVTDYCREPRDVVARLTRIGGEKDPDLERIRALAPDLVIANVEENVREHVETLRGWGIPVWVAYPRTVEGAIGMIRDLGAVTHTDAQADAMAAGLARLVDDAGARAAAEPPVPVFYAIWRDPWMTVGADTYIHDVLRVCGGANVFADAAARYPVVTLDDVAARRPHVILLPDEPYRFRPAPRTCASSRASPRCRPCGTGACTWSTASRSRGTVRGWRTRSGPSPRYSAPRAPEEAAAARRSAAARIASTMKW